MHRAQKILNHLSMNPTRGFQYPANKFEAELIQTARFIASKGKGILAADESTATIGARFKAINLPNNVDNRRNYRELLFTTPGLNQVCIFLFRTHSLKSHHVPNQFQYHVFNVSLIFEFSHCLVFAVHLGCDSVRGDSVPEGF
jgi:hypothetical protein